MGLFRIAQIMDDPKMTPSQMLTAITQMKRITDASFNLLGGIDESDLGGSVGGPDGGGPDGPNPGPQPGGNK